MAIANIFMEIAFSLLQAYGNDDLKGSFILDFHPQEAKCSFDFATNSVRLTNPKKGEKLVLPPGVVVTTYASRKSDTLSGMIMFEDPEIGKQEKK